MIDHISPTSHDSGVVIKVQMQLQLPSSRNHELVHRAVDELKRRGFVDGGQQVAIVQSGRQPIWRSASTHTISVREVPLDPEPEDA
jgi:hypothetical protein